MVCVLSIRDTLPSPGLSRRLGLLVVRSSGVVLSFPPLDPSGQTLIRFPRFRAHLSQAQGLGVSLGPAVPGSPPLRPPASPIHPPSGGGGSSGDREFSLSRLFHRTI